MITMTGHPRLPLFVDLRGREVLVVGGGKAGSRKVRELGALGAQVHVVDPSPARCVQELTRAGLVRWSERPFVPADVERVWLAVAATGDPSVLEAVHDACERSRTLLLALDSAAHGSAWSGSVLRRPPLTLAISTDGVAPALARLMREVLEHVLPGPDWVAEARRLRARWRSEGVPPHARFAELVREIAARAR